MRSWRVDMLVGAVAGMLGAVLVTPPALAQSQPALTPEGPATLSSEWRGAMTMEGTRPEVLKDVTVTVAPGGRAGLIRLRASDRSFDPKRVAVGDWVMLPAEPGRYTFPAPRVLMDHRSLVIALDQQTGGHAIVSEDACPPTPPGGLGFCESVSLDTWTPMLADRLAGAPPEHRGGEPPPTTRQPGARLEIATGGEVDQDGDLAGDTTEDRTDLVVSGSAVRGLGGQTTLTVTNRGPRTADWAQVTIDRDGVEGWPPACSALPSARFPAPWFGPPFGPCVLAALAPGASTTVSLPTIDDGRPLVATVRSEGPDLAPDDNVASITPGLAPAPNPTLRAPARTRAKSGVRVRVRSDKAGTATLSLQVRYRGALRRATRRIALRAGAARSVALRLPRVRGVRPTGRAQLTVTFEAPASETSTLERTVRLVPLAR